MSEWQQVTEPSTRTCVIHSKPTEARHGLLCHVHFEKLGAMLRDIEDQAAILSAVPSMQIRTGSGGGSLASQRSPARLDVLVHTDRRRGTGESETEDDALAAGRTLSMLDVLTSYARMVREARNYSTRGQLTISGERDLLTRALDWIAEQPWVDEMYDEIRQLLGQLKAANGTQPEKPVGKCYLPTEVGICDGPIWLGQSERVVHTVTGVWKQTAPEAAAHCARCSATWDGPQLAMLSFELEQARKEAARPKTDDGRRMLTAPELVAHGHASSVSNVRVQAHRRRVTAISGHYDPAWFTSKPDTPTAVRVDNRHSCRV